MARVLRAEEARAAEARVVRRAALAARTDADAIRADAEAEAEAILAAARADAERLRREASARGAREGRDRVAAKMIALGEARARCLDEAVAVAEPLAVAIAAAVIRSAYRADPSLVRHAVEDALDRLAGAGEVVLRVHPADVPIVEPLGAERGVRVEPDPTLGRGDCVVESDVGGIDGRVEARLGRVTAALRDALEPEAGASR
ncbi:MAG: FliH/SctL family protein [Sandaracinaceae bacterium]